jgi:thiol-disulfide isomerase/thioredoxin
MFIADLMLLLLLASQPSGAVAPALKVTQPVAPEAASPAMSAAARQAAVAQAAFTKFQTTDIDGRVLTASSLRGRVVVLDFWATWCAPCLAEVPTYQRLRREHDARRLEIIGVSVDVLDRRGLMSWLRRQQVTWTQIHDRRGYSGELAQQFKVMSLPTTYVFDAEGRMVAANLRGERLIQTVAELLGPSPGR